MKWCFVAVDSSHKVFAIRRQTSEEYCVFTSRNLDVGFRDQIVGDFDSVGHHEVEIPQGSKHPVNITLYNVGKIEALVATLGSGATPRLRIHTPGP